MITMATCQPRLPTVPGQNAGIFQACITPSLGRSPVSTNVNPSLGVRFGGTYSVFSEKGLDLNLQLWTRCELREGRRKTETCRL